MFLTEQRDGRDGKSYRKALSLCMQLSDNLFWEMNLRKRNKTFTFFALGSCIIPLKKGN